MKTTWKKASTLLALTLAGLFLTPAIAQVPRRSSGEQPRESKSYQLNAAKQIDRLIGAGFKKNQIRPVAKSTDEEFLRRTYLSAIGRIPTFEESSTFLADTAPDKRTKLVDTLLDSDGYSSNMFNFWGDMLRVKDYFSQTSGAPYIDWLKHSVETNKPYNVMVRELLTAKGSGWVEGNGAVGYYVRDLGMPLDNMANTTRIFLGTRMECAQCHDHPFDDWKQMDFYEMAAFTNGITGTNTDLARKIFQNDVERNQPQDVRAIGRMLRYSVFDFAVKDTGKGTIALPFDYQYNDGNPGEMVGAKSLPFGKRIRFSERSKGTAPGESREAFADWVTSPENANFNTVISNRMWKRVMGIGQFEPVDNLSEAKTGASHPELMKFLVDLMKELDYDLKAFQRVLFNTYAYQLSTYPSEHPDRKPYHFAGRQMSRLSAEQVWDSLLTLNVGNPDPKKRARLGGHIYYRNQPVLVGKKSMEDVYRDVSAMKGADEFWDYAKKLLKDIQADKGSARGNGGEMMAYSGKGGGSNMRASELPQPTAPGHFLRAFGQSSRDTIDGSSKDSDVTQVLEILNGHVEKTVVSNSGAQFYKDVNKGSTPEEKTERLFLAVLSRKPNDQEKAIFSAEIKSKGDQGVRNCASALICSDEFMFNR